jgi:cation diffusion facilitator family transporter
MRTEAAVLRLVLGVHLAAAAAKIGSGRLFHVLSIEADGYHALTDGAGAFAALLVARFHWRGAPLLVTGGLGLSMLVIAGRLVLDALLHARAGDSHAPEPGTAPLAVMIASFLCSAAISYYENNRARALGSTLLRADAQHTRSDCWVTAGVLFGVVAARLGAAWADPVAGLAVAVVIARTGVTVLRTTFEEEDHGKAQSPPL